MSHSGTVHWAFIGGLQQHNLNRWNSVLEGLVNTRLPWVRYNTFMQVLSGSSTRYILDVEHFRSCGCACAPTRAMGLLFVKQSDERHPKEIHTEHPSYNLALQQLRPSCAPISGNPTWPYPLFILDTRHLKPIIICEKEH